MPLNILHHKSWHVYNVKNQERVRRDEHQARLKEEEEERRMQEVDAERRMMILRKQMEQREGGGEQEDEHPDCGGRWQADADLDRFPSEPTRKRRRISPVPASTDNAAPARSSQARLREKSTQAPLFGADGHINLFPAAALDSKDTRNAGNTRSKSSQNPEYRADKAREEASYEAQYTMKISEPSRPWYASVDKISQADSEKEDKKKQWEERIETRVRESNDPLNAMISDLRKLRGQKEDAAREKKRRDADMGIGIDQRLLFQNVKDQDVRLDDGAMHRRVRRDSSDRGYDLSRQVSSYTESRRGRTSPEKEGRRRGHRSNSPSEAKRNSHRSSSRSRRHRRHHHHHHRDRRYSRSASRSPARRRDRSTSRSRSRSISSGLLHERSKNSDRRHQAENARNPRRHAKEPSSFDKLREEQCKREQAERLKVEALLKNERNFRNPERWTVTSSSSGHGRYSRQFES